MLATLTRAVCDLDYLERSPINIFSSSFIIIAHICTSGLFFLFCLDTTHNGAATLLEKKKRLH